MTRGIDQEPNKSASDNSQPSWGVHPERVPTDFGGDTPVHPDWKPDPLDVRTGNKNKVAAFVALGGVAATAVLGAAAYFGLKGAGEEIGNKITGADVNNSAPIASGQTNPERATISIDAATPDQFYSDANFTDEQRVDWAWNKINQPSHKAGYEGMTLLEAAHKELANSINYKPQYGNAEYLHELVAPSENMTGDQIQTYISTVGYLAATADMPDSDRAKILAASSDNSSPALQRSITAAVDRDVHSLSGTSEVQSHYQGDVEIKNESPVFRHYTTKNYDPAGVPSKVMDVIDTGVTNTPTVQMIVRFVHDKPTIVDVYPADSTTKRIKNPDKIPQNS